MLTADIPVSAFYGFWQANARTNKGQDPGPPPPIVPYQDRLGPNRGLQLVTWRNKGSFEWKGTTASSTSARDPSDSQRSIARPNGKRKGDDDKEADRRRMSAVNQNNNAMKFGNDEELSNPLKKSRKQNEKQDSQTKTNASPPP